MNAVDGFTLVRHDMTEFLRSVDGYNKSDGSNPETCIVTFDSLCGPSRYD